MSTPRTPRTPRSIGAGLPIQGSRRVLTTTTIVKMDRDELEEEIRGLGGDADEERTDQQLRDDLCEMLDSGSPAYLLPLLARQAADRRRKLRKPMSRSEALAEAPWDRPTMPAAWERPFREAYAARLEERGLALPAARSGSSGKGGATLLASRLLRQTAEEFGENDARAKAAGLSWSTWARRKLAT